MTSQGGEEDEYHYIPDSSGGGSLGGDGSSIHSPVGSGPNPPITLADMKSIKSAFMDGLDEGGEFSEGWTSLSMESTATTATLAAQMRRLLPGYPPLSLRITFRAQPLDPLGIVSVQGSDVALEPGTASTPFAAAYQQLLFFTLRLVLCAATAPSQADLLAQVQRVSTSNKDCIMLGTHAHASQGHEAAAAEAQQLLAYPPLKFVLDTKRVGLRLARALEYARAHIRAHCFICGKLHGEGGAGGPGSGSGSGSEGGGGESSRGSIWPHICESTFCRYQQLSDPRSVDIFTELAINDGFEVLLATATAAAQTVGDRRFALLHPVPEIFMRDVKPGECFGPEESKMVYGGTHAASSGSGSGSSAASTSTPATLCKPGRCIDYALLSLCLSSVRAKFAALSLGTLANNAEIFWALLEEHLKKPALGWSAPEVEGMMEDAKRMKGTEAFFYRIPVNVGVGERRGGGGGGGGGGGTSWSTSATASDAAPPPSKRPCPSPPTLPAAAQTSTPLLEYQTLWYVSLQLPCVLRFIPRTPPPPAAAPLVRGVVSLGVIPIPSFCPWPSLPPDLHSRCASIGSTATPTTLTAFGGHTSLEGGTRLFELVPRVRPMASPVAAPVAGGGGGGGGGEEGEPVDDRTPEAVAAAARAAATMQQFYGQAPQDLKGGVQHHFHGSSMGNWFSLLQHGILCLSNTQYMTAGAALGPGAYFGREYATSLAYAGPGGGQQAVGICEINPKGGSVKDFGWAITCTDKSLVKVKYLLVSGTLAGYTTVA